MIEPIMYMGIGFLLAALIAVAVIPLVHDRAVRLTTRRLRAALPLSMKEIQAGRDLLRADFAMATRRLEINLNQLKDKSTGQVVELSKRDDVINRLKLQRYTLNVEVIALKSQLEALKTRPVPAAKGAAANPMSCPLCGTGFRKEATANACRRNFGVALLESHHYAEEFAEFFFGGGNAMVSSNTDLISAFSDRNLWY